MAFYLGRVLSSLQNPVGTTYQNNDGYVLNSSNNSFVTKWVQVQTSPIISFKIVFSASGVAGTLTLEESCDSPSKDGSGAVCPISALHNGTYGIGAYGDPTDLMTSFTTPSSVAVSGNSVVYGFGSGGATVGLASAGWYRIKYIASSSVPGNVIVTLAWKPTA